MGTPKLKSLASLKRAIREGRKYASETENIKDPDEVSVPAEKTEQVMDQADYNIPTDSVKNTDNLGEARVLDSVTPLDTTLTAEDSDITAEKKAPVEETKQEVSLEKGASFSNKLQQAISRMKSKKVAKAKETTNVAADISLAPDILSKVAKAMVATEKGQQLAIQALEDQKAEAMKIATLNELIRANDEFEAQKSLQTKVAAAHESSFAELANFIGNDAAMLEYAKYAYAAGAQDAAMAAEAGALPPTEAVPAGDPAAEQDEIMQAISMLLQSGQIDEAGAQQLAEMAAQAAMADQNPELSDEELMMALEQAVQAGLITPEAIQQIIGSGEVAPAGTPTAPEAAPAETPAEAAAIAETTPIPEAPADAAKTAAAIIATTAMLKKAAVEEGVIDEAEAEVTPEDVAAVLEAAVESGELSPEDAQAVEEEIVAAALADAEGGIEGAEEVATPEEEEVATPEEEVVVEEAALADEGLDDISVEELAAALAEEGVTEEELAQAIADIEASEEGASDNEGELEVEGSEGDDPETKEVKEEKSEDEE